MTAQISWATRTTTCCSGMRSTISITPTHAATHRTTSAMPSKRRKAREATRSPSVRSDATGSPKSEAKLTAVEKRLRDLEAKLSRGEYHVSERVGAADAVPATRPMTFDDTARAEASGKKRTLSGGSDERENATSVREQSTQSELQRLNDTILALVQRQDKYEIERHRHQKQMYELCQTHKEHTASLESIIAAYEKRFSAISPQTPREWDGPPLSIPPRFARDEPALSPPLEEYPRAARRSARVQLRGTCLGSIKPDRALRSIFSTIKRRTRRTSATNARAMSKLFWSARCDSSRNRSRARTKSSRPWPASSAPPNRNTLNLDGIQSD